MRLPATASEKSYRGDIMSTDNGNGNEPRFQTLEGAEQDRVDEFLREHSFLTAREWALARLCADFRTDSGIEMTKLGRVLPDLVPWMDDQYSPQAVNAARQAFDEKVHRAMTTAIYGAMADFYTADKLDELMYESTEAAKLLLEAEGATVDVEAEIEAEEAVLEAMQEIRRRSEVLRLTRHWDSTVATCEWLMSLPSHTPATSKLGDDLVEQGPAPYIRSDHNQEGANDRPSEVKVSTLDTGGRRELDSESQHSNESTSDRSNDQTDDSYYDPIIRETE